MNKNKIKTTITLEELARLHSMSLKTLRRWASERRFPLYKISNMIRVSPDEFSEWLKQFHRNQGDVHR